MSKWRKFHVLCFCTVVCSYFPFIAAYFSSVLDYMSRFSCHENMPCFWFDPKSREIIISDCHTTRIKTLGPLPNLHSPTDESQRNVKNKKCDIQKCN